MWSMLNEDEHAAFEAAWLNLQRERLQNMSVGDMKERIAEVAHLATYDKLRPHVVRLLVAADEIMASVQKREAVERKHLIDMMGAVLVG
jgi:hypothetical protein